MQVKLSRLLALPRRDIVLQAVILLGLVLIVGWLTRSAGSGLERVGISTDLGFLGNAAGFPIGESLISYSPSDSYGRALLVGLLNTVKVAITGIVLMTLIGVPLGVLRSSSNRILVLFSQSYVEIVRNTPLLLQLFIWTSLIRGLPNVRQALQPAPGVFLSQRGLNLPSLMIDPTSPLSWPLLAAAAIGLLVLGKWLKGWRGAAFAGLGILLIGAALAILGIFDLEWPRLQGFRIVGGSTISPEFVALTLGLSVYGAAAVAETVRSGIQSVEAGQWEAARSLGLSPVKTAWLVIIPQMLRVVIPPMTSLYMNLTKNSSLAVAIGYPDVVYAANTIMNQSGQIVQIIVILMVVYLTMSLAVASFMNWYNQRIQLQTR